MKKFLKLSQHRALIGIRQSAVKRYAKTHPVDSIQQAQVTMAHTVVKTYQDNASKVATVPALVRGRDAFIAQLGVVRATASLQEATTEGISAMKKENAAPSRPARLPRRRRPPRLRCGDWRSRAQRQSQLPRERPHPCQRH